LLAVVAVAVLAEVEQQVVVGQVDSELPLDYLFLRDLPTRLR